MRSRAGDGTPTVANPGRRWAYLGLLLGGGASIAANVAHSFVPPASVVAEYGDLATAHWSPQPGAVVTAVIWPVFLFIAIEILSKPAWPSGLGWALLRFGGLTPVATVAAIVSYRHLSGLLEFYEEDSLTCAIGPLAVDGLMVMASGALVAISRRVVDRAPDTVEMPTATSEIEPSSAVVADPEYAPDPVPEAMTAYVETVRPTPERREPRQQVNTDSEHAQKTTSRKRARSGNAEIVRRAAESNPGASIADLVELTNLSRATVRRYKPGPSDSEPVVVDEPAEPADHPLPSTRVNGDQPRPELVDAL